MLPEATLISYNEGDRDYWTMVQDAQQGIAKFRLSATGVMFAMENNYHKSTKITTTTTTPTATPTTTSASTTTLTTTTNLMGAIPVNQVARPHHPRPNSLSVLREMGGSRGSAGWTGAPPTLISSLLVPFDCCPGGRTCFSHRLQ
ncbi:uncharacterized protein LOC134773142 [Penaeus indicus]|uniref:uncharacterized protein LOC134773142 n=1 Tax=Penaeus indicus TaxID=29960 RepID=UPI00300C7E50